MKKNIIQVVEEYDACIDTKEINEKKMQNVIKYIRENLSDENLQDFSNKCYAINKSCSGDGAGLFGGSMTDMFVNLYFKSKLNDHKIFHIGENDMKICNMPLSLKKINGKSIIALDWSKNKSKNIKSVENNNYANNNDDNKCDKKYFTDNIILINLKSSKWWKNEKNGYNNDIPAGIYIIDKYFCRCNVKLECNNKSNSLIKSHYLYQTIKNSISRNLFIKIPEHNKEIKFNIMNAFND